MLVSNVIDAVFKLGSHINIASSATTAIKQINNVVKWYL